MLNSGDFYTVWKNQGFREACVLVVSEGQALVEYEMPKGTTALVILDANTEDYIRSSVSYFDVPVHLLEAMRDEEVEWIGRPQQHGRKAVTLAEVLEKRGLSKQPEDRYSRMVTKTYIVRLVISIDKDHDLADTCGTATWLHEHGWVDDVTVWEAVPDTTDMEVEEAIIGLLPPENGG